MRNIGININTEKDPKGTILNSILDTIKSTVEKPNIKIFYNRVDIKEDALKELDFIISLGGDGTLLGIAREIAKFNIPILGVNIGNLGFLTEVDCSEFKSAMERINSGSYYIEERIMLSCNINNMDSSKQYKCLNDIVIAKGTLARMAKFEIFIDEKFYTSFTADGVIISTPTGSTAYSLSAGGPIMYPNLKLMSITPICPHSLGLRTMVIDGKSHISVNIKRQNEELYLTVDGQQSKELKDKDEVHISMSPYSCKLIKLEGYDYFDILRKKITSRTKECEGDK